MNWEGDSSYLSKYKSNNELVNVEDVKKGYINVQMICNIDFNETYPSDEFHINFAITGYFNKSTRFNIYTFTDSNILIPTNGGIVSSMNVLQNDNFTRQYLDIVNIKIIELGEMQCTKCNIKFEWTSSGKDYSQTFNNINIDSGRISLNISPLMQGDLTRCVITITPLEF